MVIVWVMFALIIVLLVVSAYVHWRDEKKRGAKQHLGNFPGDATLTRSFDPLEALLFMHVMGNSEHHRASEGPDCCPSSDPCPPSGDGDLGAFSDSNFDCDASGAND